MKRILLATVALVGVLGARNAWAATDTATMGVSASVATVCTFTTTPLDFGAVALTGATPGTGAVNVTCTGGGAYTVGLGAGTHAAGGQRNLASNGNLLAYGLFQDAGYATAWTDTGPGLLAGVGNAATQVLTVYGQIAAGQTLVSGNGTPYTDTVLVTLTY